MFLAAGRAGALLGALVCFVSCGVDGQIDHSPLVVDHPRGALYGRLGGEAGISMVVENFVGRVVSDVRINSYFLDPKVDATRLSRCLVRQIGALSGGPQQYPGEGCRDMRAAHKGMQIPVSAFNSTAVHLVAALEWAKVASADIDVILAAVRPTCHDIVTGGTGCR
jgi:truncated hemoglobin YjbI